MKNRVVLSVAAMLGSGAVVIAACTSFDEIVDATDASPANDGSDPASDAGSDTSPLTDADVPDVDPCTLPDAYFCDDFERDPTDLLGAEWNQNPGYGPALIAIVVIDAGDLPSGTRALRARHRVQDAGSPDGSGDSSRYLRFPYTNAPGAFEVSFSMRLGAIPKPSSQVLQIAFAPLGDAGESAVTLSVDQNGMIRMADEYTSGSTMNAEITDTVLTGQWTRYRLRVNATKDEARLAIEGRVQELVLALKRQHGAPKEVRLGVVYEPAQTVVSETYFDDVVIRR